MRTPLRIIFIIIFLALIAPAVSAGTDAKVMVSDFQLNDLTDLPNAPEELARIAYLSSTFRQKIIEYGIEVVPVNDRLKAELSANSATYFFDHPALAAKLAEGSNADYLVIGVALKPTYLFIYARILLVDIKTQQAVYASYVQLESSWSDQHTTARNAEKLAEKVRAKLNELIKPTNCILGALISN